MNNFQAKYLALSSQYLQEKLSEVKDKHLINDNLHENKNQQSKFQKFVTNLFK